MALGDVKSDIQAIANGGLLSIQPPSGEEWVIHNLYYSQPVIIRMIKGGNTISIDTDTSSGGRLNIAIHVTNSQYIQILNNYAGTNNMGYDGVQTK